MTTPSWSRRTVPIAPIGLIRAYLGHERLDTVQQTSLLNQLYHHMGLYYNLFQPVMRVVEKAMEPVSDGRASRLIRRYDTARTPFQRLCETDAISDSARERLETLRDTINPRKLREEIYQLLEQLFALPNAPGDPTENVHDTLHYPLELELTDEALVHPTRPELLACPEGHAVCPLDPPSPPIPERSGQLLSNIIS